MAMKRILIIDDSELTLHLVHKTLTKAGFEVFTTGDLLEFDRLVKEKKPDLIITDIKMPEISGDNICEVLKRDYNTGDIPIVFFSSLSDDELKVLAEKSGADGFISKEHGLEELESMIRNVVEGILW